MKAEHVLDALTKVIFERLSKIPFDTVQFRIRQESRRFSNGAPETISNFYLAFDEIYAQEKSKLEWGDIQAEVFAEARRLQREDEKLVNIDVLQGDERDKRC